MHFNIQKNYVSFTTSYIVIILIGILHSVGQTILLLLMLTSPHTQSFSSFELDAFSSWWVVRCNLLLLELPFTQFRLISVQLLTWLC